MLLDYSRLHTEGKISIEHITYFWSNIFLKVLLAWHSHQSSVTTQSIHTCKEIKPLRFINQITCHNEKWQMNKRIHPYWNEFNTVYKSFYWWWQLQIASCMDLPACISNMWFWLPNSLQNPEGSVAPSTNTELYLFIYFLIDFQLDSYLICFLTFVRPILYVT